MKHIALFLTLLAMLAACQPKPSSQSTKAMPTYHYTDGGSNRYVLRSDTLEYIPIKPHLSSSGMADGGDPKTVTLQPTQAEALRKNFQDAQENKAHHIANRLMGCGTLTTAEGGKETTFFIAMNAPTKAALETQLKELLK